MNVKQLKDALQTMKEIYEYDDEKTAINLYDPRRLRDGNIVNIKTVDEKTGVYIDLQKEVECDAFEQ